MLTLNSPFSVEPSLYMKSQLFVGCSLNSTYVPCAPSNSLLIFFGETKTSIKDDTLLGVLFV